MNDRVRDRAVAAAILVAVILLPLAGAWTGGSELHRLVAFPPILDVPAGYPRWSWTAFALVSGVLALVAGPFLREASRHLPAGRLRHPAGLVGSHGRRFPVWGWLAIGWTLAWWLVAWTRLPWLEAVQRFTFFPLWIGFIVTVNAAVVQRAGHSIMTRKPARWLSLFALSAVFWWLFEWLNRFVSNWHYLGVQDFGPLAYAVHASLSFSTVLPAVAAVREWLATSPGFERMVDTGPAWRWLRSRSTGVALLLAGLGALFLTGLYPRTFYPALWVAPLALAFGTGILSGAKGMWRELADGDWRRAAGWAVAALACGAFWELWNAFSAAKWIYTVPYVERWHVFEMPLLGYAGYLGFGLECGLVVERLAGIRLPPRNPLRGVEPRAPALPRGAGDESRRHADD